MLYPVPRIDLKQSCTTQREHKFQRHCRRPEPGRNLDSAEMIANPLPSGMRKSGAKAIDWWGTFSASLTFTYLERDLHALASPSSHPFVWHRAVKSREISSPLLLHLAQLDCRYFLSYTHLSTITFENLQWISTNTKNSTRILGF